MAIPRNTDAGETFESRVCRCPGDPVLPAALPEMNNCCLRHETKPLTVGESLFSERLSRS
jgi:hypothetical protein